VALALYADALRLSRESGYESGIAAVAHEKARIDEARGEFVRAEEGFRYALKFYARIRDEANLEAAIRGLATLASHALEMVDEFVPAIEREGAPIGTAEQYLWVRAHAIMSEVGREGSFWRRRLIQRSMAWHGIAAGLSAYAVEEVRRTAPFGEEGFADRVAEILLSAGAGESVVAPAMSAPTPATTSASLPFQTPDTAALGVGRLLAFLEEDRGGAWVYRGQTKEYPGPLLPLAF
jgi:hypothetical protein